MLVLTLNLGVKILSYRVVLFGSCKKKCQVFDNYAIIVNFQIEHQKN